MQVILPGFTGPGLHQGAVSVVFPLDTPWCPKPWIRTPLGNYYLHRSDTGIGSWHRAGCFARKWWRCWGSWSSNGWISGQWRLERCCLRSWTAQDLLQCFRLGFSFYNIFDHLFSAFRHVGREIIIPANLELHSVIFWPMAGEHLHLDPGDVCGQLPHWVVRGVEHGQEHPSCKFLYL